MKDIKDYLHFYLGCEAVTVKSKPEIITGHIIDLVNGNFYHAKPILRPLSDMTEEEAFDLEAVGGSTEVFELTSIVYSFDSHRMLWALKKGFDLFGLIESNLAIDSTKLPTNER